QQLASEHRLLGGTPEKVDGRTVLRIENTNQGPLQLSLFTIEKPAITARVYAVFGEIKFENVQGAGYLEMWNVFPPSLLGSTEDRFFSRTLGDFGPMGKITGTSGWRAFSLPFDRTGTTNVPTRLEVNIFLPGPG